jgi:RNA polymerase sigma-70 factor (ECF subfamily)
VFARLVDQYHASLRRIARLYIANRAVADEVVQDTWLGVIQGIWLSRAVRHSRPGSFA